MKKVILSLAIAGGLVSGNCFAIDLNLCTNDNNSGTPRRKEVTISFEAKVAGNLVNCFAKNSNPFTNVENNPNQSKLKRIAIKMCNSAARSAAVTATSSFIKKTNMGTFRKNLFLSVIGIPFAEFQQDIKLRNPDFFAKFTGAIIGSEFISFLFNRNKYHVGFLFRNWYDDQKDRINFFPTPLKVFPIYSLILKGAEMCAGKDINELDPPEWLLNKGKVNRIIKAPACKLASMLDKIYKPLDKNCEPKESFLQRVSTFFDQHKLSLGTILRKKIESHKVEISILIALMNFSHYCKRKR